MKAVWSFTAMMEDEWSVNSGFTGRDATVLFHRWRDVFVCVSVQMQKGQLPERPSPDLPHLHLRQRGSVGDPALSALSCQSHSGSLAQRNHPGGRQQRWRSEKLIFFPKSQLREMATSFTCSDLNLLYLSGIQYLLVSFPNVQNFLWLGMSDFEWWFKWFYEDLKVNLIIWQHFRQRFVLCSLLGILSWLFNFSTSKNCSEWCDRCCNHIKYLCSGSVYLTIRLCKE